MELTYGNPNCKPDFLTSLHLSPITDMSVSFVPERFAVCVHTCMSKEWWTEASRCEEGRRSPYTTY